MTQTTMPVDNLIDEWMQDTEFKAEYDALEAEFDLARALIDARSNCQLTQEQIAERMGTSRTTVARLESGKANPSLKTLQRYADATGSKLEIRFSRSDQAFGS